MIEQTTGNLASGSLVGLCLAITVALVLGAPAARAYAGVRIGEPTPVWRAAAVRTAVALAVWLAITGGLAAAGWLAKFDRFPPPVMPLLGVGFALTFVAAFTRFGERLVAGLPLALIVGYQGFRVAVEIMLHQAYGEGVIGAQMTWTGLNFDVVSGVTGLGLGLWLWSRGADQPVPKWVLWAWNALGLGLLLTIVGIAILSFPGPLARFDGPANTWITTVPFVWLPTVMVTAALFGHLLLARALLGHRAPAP